MNIRTGRTTKIAHRDFVLRYKELSDAFASGKTSSKSLMHNLEMEVGYWRVSHISGTDRKMTASIIIKLEPEDP